MQVRRVYFCAALLACLSALPAAAQRLLILPPSNATVSQFSTDLAPLTAGTAATGAFTAFTNSQGNLFFIVSSGSMVELDSNGAAVGSPVTSAQPITGATRTPDGKYILLTSGSTASGSLNIYDISGGTMAPAGTVVVPNQPLDVAASPDSSKAYVLSASGLSAVDLAAKTAGTQLSLQNLVVGRSHVVMGPNGFLYVNATAAIYEIDPRTMTLSATITETRLADGLPNEPIFTPDGNTALVANPAGTDSSHLALLTIDLTNDAVSGGLTGFGPSFDQLIYVSNTLVYAYSISRRTLYSTTASLGNIGGEATFPIPSGTQVTNQTIEDVRAVFTSNEFPTPRYMFVVSGSGPSAILYRIDVNPPSGTAPNQIVKLVPFNAPTGPGFYFAPASTSNPIRSFTYNTTQTVAAGGFSKPLVIRVVDGQSHPVFGAPVTWVASSGTLVSSMATTNLDGIAQAIAQAPAGGGSFGVTATPSGVAGATFTLNGGGGGGTGGGGGGTSGGSGAPGISITSGNGQVIPGGLTSAEPMVVTVRDNSGNAAPGATVKFTMTSGPAGVLALTSRWTSNCTIASGQSFTCKTDTLGQVGLSFQAPPLSPLFASYSQTAVSAALTAATNVPAGTVNFYMIAVPATTIGGGPGSVQASTVIAPGIGKTITGQAGQTVAGAVKIHVNTLNGVDAPKDIPNVGLQIRTSNTKLDLSTIATSAACSTGIVLSDANGAINCDLVLGNTPGLYQLYAWVGSNTPIPITVLVNAAPPPPPVPTTITITQGAGGSGPAGTAIALAAIVKDQNGNVMPNQAVTWAVNPATAATLSNQTATSSSRGVVSATATIGNTPGAFTVTVRAGTVTATWNLTAIVSIGGVTVVSGDNQTVVVGTAFQPLVVKVTDSSGAVVPGVAVGFAVTSGSVVLGSNSAPTNADGIASVTATAGPAAGASVVTATAAGKSATFHLTARPPGPVLTQASFVNAASFRPGPIGFGSVAAVVGDGLTSGLPLAANTCYAGNQTPGGSLPTRLAGVEVQFGGTLAPIFAVCKGGNGVQDQVNVQVPMELPPGYAFIVLVRIGMGTASQQQFGVDGIQVVAASPGIFQYTTGNSTIAVATRPNGTVVSATNPALRGETIRIFATGLGPTLPNVASNQVGTPGEVAFFKPQVSLSGTGIAGATADYAENLIGVFVVTFQIPEDIPPGNLDLALNVVHPDGAPLYPGSATAKLPVQ